MDSLERLAETICLLWRATTGVQLDRGRGRSDAMSQIRFVGRKIGHTRTYGRGTDNRVKNLWDKKPLTPKDSGGANRAFLLGGLGGEGSLTLDTDAAKKSLTSGTRREKAGEGGNSIVKTQTGDGCWKN